MELPEIIKDRMDMNINDQLSVILFPDDEGKPRCYVLKLKFKEIEGKETSILLTPCEAMEIVSGLSTAVQFYLYNQEQYREEVLKPRLESSAEREEKSDVAELPLKGSSYSCGDHMIHCTMHNCDECNDNPENKHFPK